MKSKLKEERKWWALLAHADAMVSLGGDKCLYAHRIGNRARVELIKLGVNLDTAFDRARDTFEELMIECEAADKASEKLMKNVIKLLDELKQ